MEESLKTARLLYRTLLILSLGVALLAINPAESTRYEEAIDELAQLRSSGDKLWRAATSSDVLAAVDKSVSPREFGDVITAAAEEHSVAVRAMLAPTHIAHNGRSVLPYVVLPKVTKTPESVSEYLALRDSTVEARVFVPDPDSLRDAMHRLLERQDRGDRLKMIVFGLQLNERTRRVLPDSLNSVDVFAYSLNRGTQIPHTSQVQGGVRNVQLPLAPSTVAPPSGTSLQTVLTEIAGEEIDNAIAYLRAKQAERMGKIAFLGFEIEEDTALVVVPVVFIVLLLYFLTLLKHLLRIGHLEPEVIRAFPWLFLFPDRLSGLLVYTSVCALPSLLVATLLWRAWPEAGVPQLGHAALVVAQLMVTALVAVQLVRTRRKLCAPDKALEGTSEDTGR